MCNVWNNLYAAAGELYIVREFELKLKLVSFMADGRIRVDLDMSSTPKRDYVRFLLAGINANIVKLGVPVEIAKEMFKEKFNHACHVAESLNSVKFVNDYMDVMINSESCMEIEPIVNELRKTMEFIHGRIYDETSGIPIKSLELSSHTKNALLRAGIKTTNQLPEDIDKLEVRGIGVASKNELKRVLKLE